MITRALLTTSEIAASFGVSSKTIGEWEKARMIKPLVGGKYKRWCVHTTLAQLRKFQNIHVREFLTPTNNPLEQ